MPPWRNGRGYGVGTVPPFTHSRLTGLKYLVPYLIPGTWYRDGSTLEGAPSPCPYLYYPGHPACAYLHHQYTVPHTAPSPRTSIPPLLLHDPPGPGSLTPWTIQNPQDTPGSPTQDGVPPHHLPPPHLPPPQARGGEVQPEEQAEGGAPPLPPPRRPRP